jgi:hypothetical protein
MLHAGGTDGNTIFTLILHRRPPMQMTLGFIVIRLASLQL